MRTPKGVISIDNRDVAETYRCCHCGNHFIYRRGSGIQRGYCMKCNELTCGHKNCDPCIPFEAKVTYSESKYRNEYQIIKKLEGKYPLIGITPL